MDPHVQKWLKCSAARCREVRTYLWVGLLASSVLPTTYTLNTQKEQLRRDSEAQAPWRH